ncbi:SHD1 domain-containing protein [Pontiella sulfatireligans]|uniref:Beta-porphyranase B n=1 Tax=Pontiella sulfatireligans TaxID=2750658 RepID=A0A6C2UNK5_9BACT|nr:family 16 glycosylhydrolase [Pontiella sulfatireligans]VGO21523.1 Beta-porphyranase B [Pontiella sulfatireligans]
MKRALSSLLFGLVLPAFGEPPPAPKGFRWEENPQFSDEFDGNALDAKKWHDHHPRWKGRPPARFMPENVSVSGGCLRQTNSMLDKPISERGQEFTIGGAAVVSKKVEAFYGYYECRLKASNISMSSTFWMSNSGHHYKGIGRISQELDILETVGGAKNNPKFATCMNSNTHVWHNREKRQVGNKAQLPGASHEDFNVYGAWWVDANKVRFYLNNKFVGEVEFDTSLIPHPFEHPMHINMVTETYDWETPPTPEEVNNPAINTTLIDWVRAYTLEPSDGSMADWKLKKLHNDFREWKSANGKSTTTAKLVKAKYGYAHLEKKNGKEIKIPIKLLSENDQALLEKVMLSQ